MHILLFQHHPAEHPGYLRHLLEEDGHTLSTIALDQHEPLPEHYEFDALWVFGGPMDVWQEAQYPWLSAEKKYIRTAVQELGMPYLGLCLGHQLLAEALGGSVGPGEAEVGIFDIQLTEAGATGVLCDGLPTRFPALQWHSAEVKTLPSGAEVLATSPVCAVQAMRWGTRAYSMQFHVEVEVDTVAAWAAIPEYRTALVTALGTNGASALDQQCQQHLAEFNRLAERIYINWLQTSARC